MRASRRTALRAALCGLAAMTGQVATAQAETLGETGGGGGCGAGIVIVGRDQSPVSGTVTAFRFLAGSGGTAGAQGQLEVLRPQGGDRYLVVGHSDPVTNPASNEVVTVPASIPIAAGDVLGSYGISGTFPCARDAATGDILGFSPVTPETGSVISASASVSQKLNLQAEIATAAPATLLTGHGVTAARTRFDFTVTGTPAAPTGTATLTGDDGKRIRNGAITCYRQIDATRAIFGVRDPAPRSAATTYREFYASDSATGDRLREQATRSASAPPVGCRTKTPPAGAGRKIRSGSITAG